MHILECQRQFKSPGFLRSGKSFEDGGKVWGGQKIGQGRDRACVEKVGGRGAR